MSRRLLAVAVTVSAVLTSQAFAADTPATTTPAAKTTTAAPTAAQRYGTWGVDLEGMDRTVKPGDDFFKYVNGKWAATTQIPPDQTRYGAFNILRDLSEARVRGIVEQWAADKKLKAGSDEAKVAAFYRTFMDEAAIEKLDAKPLEALLAPVKKIATRDDVARTMAQSFQTGAGSTFVVPFVSDDAKNPEKYTLYFSQSGLGLPDREYYLRDNFKPQKERYQKYVADMLGLAGWAEPEKNAADIVALETKIAEAHWTRAESRDRDKTYTPMTVAELEKTAPGFPWGLYFKASGLEKAPVAVVRQNTALPKLAKIFAETPVSTLQAWQAFHVTDDAAPLLSKRFADTAWEFRSKFLNGAQEQRPRWKRAVGGAEGVMGEAIGRTYVASYFPPESKAKMEKLVSDLRTAMKGRIEKLEWMGPETKAKALEKLSKFGVKIGYPSKWRDYSKLDVREGDLVGNIARAAKFDWDYSLSRLGKKVDDEEWGMTPQTVNAYYASTKNEIVFPAAILQPPFFDPNADPAVNYGAIGGVIGHEITHGFDDQGRKSDGEGMLRDWWSADDAAKFEAQAGKLGAQYEGFQLPQAKDIHIIGKQTMGENIGDLGGVLMALDAYRISLNGKPAPVIDGFTGEQRFFLGWGQVWRTLVRDQALAQLIMTDSHSPGMVRAFAPLRNVDAWYDAFGIKEGDAEYVKPEERVRIW
ncbi:MAG TPA: M13-type metalloendopeptidase [Thermoanaerobaculia bacterium]|nr:M13-type metalloendopeptidase [Thermoanaerobaculia bacterium]